jgi:hypothetical protein
MQYRSATPCHDHVHQQACLPLSRTLGTFVPPRSVCCPLLAPSPRCARPDGGRRMSSCRLQAERAQLRRQQQTRGDHLPTDSRPVSPSAAAVCGGSPSPLVRLLLSSCSGCSAASLSLSLSLPAARRRRSRSRTAPPSQLVSRCTSSSEHISARVPQSGEPPPVAPLSADRRRRRCCSAAASSSSEPSGEGESRPAARQMETAGR